MSFDAIGVDVELVVEAPRAFDHPVAERAGDEGEANPTLMCDSRQLPDQR